MQLSQPIRFVEQVTRGLSATRFSSQALTLNALSQSGRVYLRALQQTLGTLGQAIRRYTAARTSPQPFQILPGAARGFTASRLPSQTLTLRTLTVSWRTFLESVRQSLGLTAGADRHQTLTRITVQPLNQLASAARKLFTLRSPSEKISLRSIVQGFIPFDLFTESVSQALSFTGRLARSVSRYSPKPPPRPPPFTRHTRVISESVSFQGAAARIQRAFRAIVQTISTGSGVLHDLTAAAQTITDDAIIVYTRFASSVMRLLSGAEGIDLDSRVSPGRGLARTLTYGFVVGAAIAALTKLREYWKNFKGAGALAEHDMPPEEPPEAPPEPEPIPVD